MRSIIDVANKTAPNAGSIISIVEGQVYSQMDYIDSPPISATQASAIVTEYLLQRLQVYRELCDIRTEVRTNPSLFS